MSSVNTGACATTGGLYRPTHLCVAHFVVNKKVCTKKSFFCYVVRLGGVVHVSGGRGFVWGFREGRGDLSSGLSQPGGNNQMLCRHTSKVISPQVPSRVSLTYVEKNMAVNEET